MRIIQFINQLGSGGAERFVVDLANEQAARGHDVTLLMLRSDADPLFGFNCKFVSEKVKLISLKLAPGIRLKDISLVIRTIRSINPDVVHSHLGVLPYLLPFAFIRSNTKFFHTVHNLADVDTPSKIMRAINKMCFARHVNAVTISKECSNSFRSYYKRNDCAQIDNGRAPVGASRDFDRFSELMSGLQRPVFVHVARYAHAKNQELLVDAFNDLSRQGIPYTLLVVGENYQTVPELVAKACKNIRFVGVQDNVGDYLLISDYFCLSSRVEGMPISAIEAMSCGLPIVSTPAGGLVDVVIDGVNGFLSTGHTKEEYLCAVEKTMNTRFDKEKIKSIFRENYSIAHCANNYLSLYKSR